MDVEVCKEKDEREGIANQNVVHPLGEVAINVERVEGMDDGKGELELWREREGGREGGREGEVGMNGWR